jgi:thioredoxin-like negative regulator of GroEL
MLPRSIPADTDPVVCRLLVERWRAMTVAERVELVDQITADVELLAVTGILAGDPGLSDVQVRHELARRRFGAGLADAAFQHLLV